LYVHEVEPGYISLFGMAEFALECENGRWLLLESNEDFGSYNYGLAVSYARKNP